MGIIQLNLVLETCASFIHWCDQKHLTHVKRHMEAILLVLSQSHVFLPYQYFNASNSWSSNETEWRLIIGYRNSRIHFIFMNSIFCCLIIQMKMRTWGTKIVTHLTHLIIFKMHNPLLGSQRMQLVIDFKAVVCVFSAVTPMVASPLLCGSQWECDVTEEDVIQRLQESQQGIAGIYWLQPGTV